MNTIRDQDLSPFRLYQRNNASRLQSGFGRGGRGAGGRGKRENFPLHKQSATRYSGNAGYDPHTGNIHPAGSYVHKHHPEDVDSLEHEGDRADPSEAGRFPYRDAVLAGTAAPVADQRAGAAGAARQLVQPAAAPVLGQLQPTHHADPGQVASSHSRPGNQLAPSSANVRVERAELPGGGALESRAQLHPRPGLGDQLGALGGNDTVVPAGAASSPNAQVSYNP